MTNYTITYRADDGSIATTTLEAADRAACVAACRARGITPVSIKEGQASKAKGHTSKPRNSETPKLRNPETSKPRNLQVPVLALLALVSIGAAVWFFFLRTPSEQVKDPKLSPKVPSKTERVTVSKTPTESNDAKLSIGNGEVSRIALSAGSSISNDDQNMKAAEEALRMEEAMAEARQMQSNAVFKTRTDQLLAMALSGDLNRGMPPLPPMRISNQEFMESLKQKIEILDTDSEAVKKMKQMVLDARKEILEQLKQGRTVQEVLKEHEKLRNENGKLRQDAQRELNAIFASGDIEGAKKYFETMNKALSGLGVSELRMPKTEAERAKSLEERKARARERRLLREKELQEKNDKDE